jgi:hypothetical protein
MGLVMTEALSFTGDMDWSWLLAAGAVAVSVDSRPLGVWRVVPGITVVVLVVLFSI